MAILAKGVDDAANDLKKDTAKKLVNLLIWETPVDTSEALSNWQADNGNPMFNYITAYFEGAGGSTQTASALEAIRAAEATIDAARPGQPIAIFNAAPHIRALNEGSSRQAPAGFVEAQIMIARRFMRQRGLKIRGA